MILDRANAAIMVAAGTRASQGHVTASYDWVLARDGIQAQDLL